MIHDLHDGIDAKEDLVARARELAEKHRDVIRNALLSMAHPRDAMVAMGAVVANESADLSTEAFQDGFKRAAKRARGA